MFLGWSIDNSARSTSLGSCMMILNISRDLLSPICHENWTRLTLVILSIRMKKRKNCYSNCSNSVDAKKKKKTFWKMYLLKFPRPKKMFQYDTVGVLLCHMLVPERGECVQGLHSKHVFRSKNRGTLFKHWQSDFLERLQRVSSKHKPFSFCWLKKIFNSNILDFFSRNRQKEEAISIMERCLQRISGRDLKCGAQVPCSAMLKRHCLQKEQSRHEWMWPHKF